MKLIFFLMLATLAGMCSCQKSSNAAPDASKVVITITSPQAGQVYASGDSIRINATISYPGELHGYEVKITDSAGFILYDDAQHLHDDHFTISDVCTDAGTTAATLKLELIAKLDDNGTSTEQVVSFRHIP